MLTTSEIFSNWILLVSLSAEFLRGRYYELLEVKLQPVKGHRRVNSFKSNNACEFYVPMHLPPDRRSEDFQLFQIAQEVNI